MAKSQHGAVAQLGEHLLCKQGVTGSIPVSSTKSDLAASRSEPSAFYVEDFNLEAGSLLLLRENGEQVSSASGLAHFGERSGFGCLTTKLIG